jgi:YebC/PmpR family DNA-binding regulatory protein
MAGHSKWANIKHRKDRADQKKGKIFSRIIKEIISAVKQGGSDPKSNSKLRIAIGKAKEANVPSENIERNIKKASSSDQSDYVEVSYELYGFGGVGLIAEGMTDNKNRIASEMRIATNKCGGTIATPGAVAFNFDRRGLIRIGKEKVDEEPLFLLVSEAGAEDLVDEGDEYLVVVPVEAYPGFVELLTPYQVREAVIGWVPKSLIECSDEEAGENIALIEWLEKLDDVDAVYHNMK